MRAAAGSIGRFVASPRRKMLRDLALLWFGQIVTKGVTFVAFAVLARRLLPGEYGAVEYALGLATFAALIVDGGLGSVGVRRLTQGEMPARVLAPLIAAAQLCLVAIVAPGMLLFGWLFAKDANAVALVAAVSVSVMLLPFKQDWLFQSLGKMSHIVAAQTLRTMVFALGMIFVVTSGARLDWVGLTEIASVAVATLYLMIVQARTIAPVGVSFVPKEIAGLGREGAAIGLGAVAWASIQYAPLLMLANLAGMVDTGYFGAAHRLGVSLVTFSWIYHFNLYPTIARKLHGDPAAVAVLTRASLRATAWAGTGLALGLTLCAEPLMILLFGARFGAAASPFTLLIWTFPITLISGHARWILIAARRANDVLVAQLIGVAVAIALGWILIVHYGAAGAGAAMSLACLAVWIASTIFAKARGHHVPLTPCLRPIALAGMILAAASFTALDPWLSAALGLGVFVALAPLLDPQLLRDIRRLGAAEAKALAVPGTGELT